MTDTARPVVRSMATVKAQPVEHARGAAMEVVLGADDGVPHFVTRRFTIAPGGRIPCHRHDTIEHEQVVLEGAMVVGLDGREQVAAAGDCLFIPPGVAHWYENRGDVPVRFLCVVPRTEVYQTEWLESAE
jgi:quercetin dioxygenase-like cupin family protein